MSFTVQSLLSSQTIASVSPEQSVGVPAHGSQITPLHETISVSLIVQSSPSLQGCSSGLDRFII